MDSPLRIHTWQASSWFRKHRWGPSKRPCPSCLLEKHFSSKDVSHPPPPRLPVLLLLSLLEERSWAGALSTAAFYSPCLQTDRFQVVRDRDQGLVQRERCGNSHSDDGWGPRWDRRLAPSRLVSAALLHRCRAPRTLPLWLRRHKRAGVSGASQPIATPQKPNTCVWTPSGQRGGMCLTGEPGSRLRMTCPWPYVLYLSKLLTKKPLMLWILF